MRFDQVVAVLAGSLTIASAGPMPHMIRDVEYPSTNKREVPSSHAVHERQLPHWARSWRKVAKVPRKTLLPMRIGLKQSNLEQGPELLWDM
jgi:tripeptidyl-peptidase I